MAMILAVLEARCGLSFATAEVYLNVAGGYRLTDPAADLAVAAALVSALSERPVPGDCVVFGEIALSGEVRPVAHAGLRLKEAAKLGLREGVGAGKGVKGGEGVASSPNSPISAHWSTRSSVVSWLAEAIATSASRSAMSALDIFVMSCLAAAPDRLRARAGA